MASYQYIYTMRDLRKVFPGGREVLKDITLAFFPGAKIGVIGGNGAGKSTLLRIMAGLETEFTGEAWAAEGVRVGLLSQEPELDPEKDVQGNVTDGVRATKDLLDKFEAVSLRFAEEMTDDEMGALIEEQGELQEQIDNLDAWDLDRHIEIAMDALRCPPGDTDVTQLSGGLVPVAAGEAGSVVAGRTHQPSGCRIRGLAGTPFSRIHRHCRGHHP